MRVGIDIGGTFTDIVCIEDDGAITTRKVPSSVDDYSRSIREALPEILAAQGIEGAAVREVIHGTTVATNAVLEQSGARTALITTEGFRDVLELRRVRIPELYTWMWDKPPDLVERRFRGEVRERIDARGDVLIPLDEEGADRMLEQLLALGIDSLAVCFINSYVNPIHEERLAKLIARRCSGVSVSLSHEILREVREYERTATTVVNAYVRPLVERYVASLENALQDLGLRAPLLIMQSNGGVMTAESSCRRPVFMIESGPAAGVIASHALGASGDIPNAITFDMGGTTAKASIIEKGTLSRAAEYEVGSSLSATSRLIKGGGHLIRIPVIDVAEVGAGGGSIAWVDPGGVLHVGPRSAGSTPGPVCYALGGTQTTITDANLLLGYINPEGLVGGNLKLQHQLAERALREQIAEPLDLDLIEAAYGVHLMANSAMMRAVRSVSTERGRDVRDFALVGFGGSGPIHACGMAHTLEMEQIVIPPHPGLFSAFGLLAADIEHHQVQTYYKSTDEVDLEQLNATLTRLEEETRGLLSAEGFSDEEIEIQRSADMRYAGQSYELTIPVLSGDLGPNQISGLEEAFEKEHEKTYGHRGSLGEKYAFVNFRVVGKVAGEGLPTSSSESPSRSSEGSRRAYFGAEYGWIDTPVRGRQDLDTHPRTGPYLIDEYDSTTVVSPDFEVCKDERRNIRIQARK